MKRALVAALLVVLAVTAFAGGQGETAGTGPATVATGPLEPYDPPLVVTTWRRQDNRNFVEGQDLENNIWTQAFEEELGIVFEYAWIAPSGEFNAKVNTSIAAGDFPDLMNKLNLEQYYNLARVGRLAPQGDLIEQYDIGEVAKYLDIAGGINRDMMTINGEIYGWGVGPRLSDVRVFAARSDWLEAVGRDVPQTVEEIIDVLYAFSDEDPDGNGQDDTYGLAAAAGFLGGGLPLDAFFALYQSYPNIWVEENGSLVYGSLTDETRDALEVLVQLHADGVLSPEWPVFGTWTEGPDEIAQENVGAAFGQQWWHNWGGPTRVVANNPGVIWEHSYPRDVSGDYMRTPVSAQVTDINAINSDFSNPEVLVKIYNLHYMKMTNPETADGDFHTIMSDRGPVSSFFYWADFFASHEQIDRNPVLARQVSAALEARDPSELGPEAMGYYTRSLEYLNGTADLTGNDTGYGSYRTFGPGGTMDFSWLVLENDLQAIDGFQSVPTRAQARFAGDLRSTRDELFIQMIVGELDLDEGWNQWLAYWDANGGGDWTAEVNEWYEAQ